MRKLFLVLLVSMAASGVSAQIRRSGIGIEWGVLGGINLTNYETKFDAADVQNRMGWQLGMSIAAKFGWFAIEPQLLYVHHGMKINIADAANVRLKSNSIDVPVLFSVRVLRPLRINIGPVLSVMNDCKYKSGGSTVDFGRIRPTVSYTAGVGLTLLGHMLVDLRYNGQFNSVKNPMTDRDLNIDLRANSVALSFGYIF